MNTRLETLFEKEIGRFRIVAEKHFDESPDFSYLGKFVPKMDWSPETFIYHRPSGLMFDGRLWRNKQGQIQAEPDMECDYRHDGCTLIDIGSCQFKRSDSGSLKMAFENARQLDALDDSWGYVGVWAKVYLEGREIGSASLWGIEDDWAGFFKPYNSESYILECARDVAKEAVHDARQFMQAICA